MFEKTKRLRATRQVVEIKAIIREPCHVRWNSMAGDDKVRHCDKCQLNVYNFIGMSADEIREVLTRKEGRVCARIYARPDGTMLAQECNQGEGSVEMGDLEY